LGNTLFDAKNGFLNLFPPRPVTFLDAIRPEKNAHKEVEIQDLALTIRIPWLRGVA